MIAEKLKAVTQRIARCCEKSGRQADDVKLVCVTKEASPDQMKEAMSAGVSIFGENRVQDAMAKHKVLGGNAAWHLIGHLQTNKVKDAVSIFSLIHSVDSLRLAHEINRQAANTGKVQEILIQVNTSGEKTKFGVTADEAVSLFKEISLYTNLSIKGLMTMAPETEGSEAIRLCFRALKDLSDSINRSFTGRPGLQILSMGMTNDFEIAIEEGSNMVRIGRAIFE